MPRMYWYQPTSSGSARWYPHHHWYVMRRPTKLVTNGNGVQVNHLKMDYEIRKDSEWPLVFLYKVSQGVSGSYAFEVAASVGLRSSLVDRAREIYEDLKNGRPIRPLPQVGRQQRPPPGMSLNHFLRSIEVPDIFGPQEE